MKINIKTRRAIEVKEVKTINFREIRTFAWMKIGGINMSGENISVKRI